MTALEGDWNIRECVQFHVYAKFLSSSIACAQIFLEHENVLCVKILQVDAHKLCAQISRFLFWLHYWYTGRYSRRVRFTETSPWSLVYDADIPPLLSVPLFRGLANFWPDASESLFKNLHGIWPGFLVNCTDCRIDSVILSSGLWITV